MQTIRFESSNIEPYPLQVQGESFNRTNIEKVVGYYDDEGVDDDSFWAHLVLEDENKAAPGVAVRVEIDGEKVGYLSTPSAKQYRNKLKELGLTDVIGECHASIKGGFTKRDGTVADFGVRLDLDPDCLRVYKPSMPKVAPAPAPLPKYVVPVEPKQTLPVSDALNTIFSIAIKFIKWAFARERYQKTIITLIVIYAVIYALISR